MSSVYKIPLVLAPQPEGGYTVTSPVLPELVTEADTMDEVVNHVRDAIQAVMEVYEDLGKPLPENLRQDSQKDPIRFECLVSAGR
jgi:antitoxin HicB